ncbi:MAG: Asp-tRNA(Asn)/Glu-tRNA(Gln) amidotransferase subunit GatC [Calditrichaeota bacterium]|nr:MAG: Asp-tRNA(Asn)/Glu-tRNA(Gln) amidotransferase subunit GatC [Calditrichota bacterium]
MSITLEDVERIAALAKLRFDKRRLQDMARDLDRIVGYVEKLKELDVSEVPETAHAVQLDNVLREDEVEQWLTNEEALANAPASKNGFFSVPKVIG